LEAAWQHGEVPNRQALHSYLEAALWQTGRASVPFVMACYREPERLRELDQWFHAFTSNHVANRASRMQGRALWLAVQRMLASRPSKAPGRDGERALDFLGIQGSMNPPWFHLAPVFGYLFRGMGIEAHKVAGAFLFNHLRSVLAAGVRLNCVGPMEAQAIQLEFAPLAERVAQVGAALPVEEAAQTSPLLEIWQGAQDRLYSRLFQS
jgi:urease accessory protein